MQCRKRKHRFRILRFLFSCLMMMLFVIVSIGGGFRFYDWILEENIASDMKKMEDMETSFNQELVPPVEESNTNKQDPIYQQLQSLIPKDKRIQTILNDYEIYPESLLDMLTRNLEMLDFVLDYPKKQGNVYSEHVDSVSQGEIPLLLQWDEQWGYASYGDGLIATNGCAPTALSMVIVGLRRDVSITPYVVAKFAEENGYYVNGTGTSWSLIASGSQSFGVLAEELPLSKNDVYTALANGMPIICSVRPGDFTTTGHFIVLTGIKNGLIKVNDPNSIKRSNQLWEYSTLAKQIDNLWAFSTI